MNNDPQLNQRIKRVLERLTKIQKMLFWFRLLLWLIAYRARRYLAGLFVSSRSRAHWIGSHRRPRRLERPLLYFLFPVAMVLLEPREFATWAAIFGGFTAFCVPLFSIYWLVARKANEGSD